MIAATLQIASSAAPNLTGAAATSKSPALAADVQSAFQRQMRNELGKLADRPLKSALPADGAQPAKQAKEDKETKETAKETKESKDSTTGKAAKKQVSTALPAATATPDEAAAQPQLQSFASFSFPSSGTNGASISSTFTVQPDACPGQPSGSQLGDESAGEVHPAGHEKPRATTETMNQSLASATSATSARSAKPDSVEDVSHSQSEPSKAAQAGQSRSSTEAVAPDAVKAGDRADQAEFNSNDDPTNAVAAQTTSALPASPLSAAVAAQILPASLAELTRNDASSQMADGVSSVKQSPVVESPASRKDSATGHDHSVDSRVKSVAAAAERKAPEASADRVADTAETATAREQAAPAHASDAVSNAVFTQALAAERSKPSASETIAQEPAQGASATTVDHASGGDESNVLQPSALHLQSARLTGNDTQAEMQVGLQTADYGHVEIKTTLQNSALGATIAVEHTALREQIVSALPDLRHSFTERQITLDSLTVSDSLSATTSFTNSHQQRSNQQQAAVPYQGSQERAAEPDWETKSGALPGPVLPSWGGDSGSELNVLV